MTVQYAKQIQDGVQQLSKLVGQLIEEQNKQLPSMAGSLASAGLWKNSESALACNNHQPSWLDHNRARSGRNPR